MAYPWFLHILNAMDRHAQVFSIIVTFSELAVGAGLLLGCLTGIAAAGAVALNFLYITGGSAGVNGVFIVLGVLLIAAWRVAGYFGVDYFLLPLLGTPWEPGTIFGKLRPRRKAVEIAQQTE
jgi:thiosulfate dehydrogenase [quinone] large subunit